MKKLLLPILVIIITFSTTIVHTQTSSCNLTGGSVYVDHSTTPVMMNATVNGMPGVFFAEIKKQFLI